MPLVPWHFAVSSVTIFDKNQPGPSPVRSKRCWRRCRVALVWWNVLSPNPGCAGQASVPEPITWDPQPFLEAELRGVFADGLVCGVPERLPGSGFRLEVGCLQPSRFQQLSIVFDDQRRLQCWGARFQGQCRLTGIKKLPIVMANGVQHSEQDNAADKRHQQGFFG